MVVHDGDIKPSPLWGEQSPYAGRIISALAIIYYSEQMDCDFINCLFLYSDLLNLTGGRTKREKQRNGLSFVSRGVTVCSRPKQNSQNRDVKPVYLPDSYSGCVSQQTCLATLHILLTGPYILSRLFTGLLYYFVCVQKSYALRCVRNTVHFADITSWKFVYTEFSNDQCCHKHRCCHFCTMWCFVFKVAYLFYMLLSYAIIISVFILKFYHLWNDTDCQVTRVVSGFLQLKSKAEKGGVCAWSTRGPMCVTKQHSHWVQFKMSRLFVAHIGRWWVAGVWGGEEGLHGSEDWKPADWRRVLVMETRRRSKKWRKMKQVKWCQNVKCRQDLGRWWISLSLQLSKSQNYKVI